MFRGSRARRLTEPVDGAGLAAFRALFGAVLLYSTVRFAAYGWIDELLIAPQYHFTYYGFDWVRPWPGWGMYLHFALMGLSALGILLGAWTRLSAALYFLTFTYVELIDKATYLNHYYFVSLMALLLVFVPVGRVGSIDAWRRARRASVEAAAQAAPVRLWSYALLRAQLALVYFFAGFAKLNGDWLVRGEPMRTWLLRFGEAPLIGPELSQAWTAHTFSIAGAIYDLTIVGWLLWRRSRPYAYAAVVVFHVTVWLLFPIGVFSWVMLSATTLFFDPDWPRALARRVRAWRTGGAARPLPSPPPAERSIDSGERRRWFVGGALALAYLALQVLTPLRFLLYPGNVNWHEQGFRFAWRVMLIEKTGQVELEVVSGEQPPRRAHVLPREALTPLQYKMMSTQPDMIQEYAQHVGRRYQAQGWREVRVYASAWAALNGRPRQRLIDPSVDLMRVPRSLAPKSWIVPLAQSALEHDERYVGTPLDAAAQG
jgi:vitamin K-dependent gamma-carboxylase